ncbi:MAG: c-type cytochrome [Sulfurospirillaceae bacterium]|nr:c-type cytochrome [Sulfurospirillaceae bacterium]MDD2827797.1 c-type cytochrome [Sulfurospirillaceae bacterium]
MIYYGVEPFAHSQMHPHVAPADFAFKDLGHTDKVGDPVKGKELVSSNCTACHGLQVEGFPSPMPNADAAMAYGVVPPDLSTAGALYDVNYLAGFIKEPTKAAHLQHKFDDTKPYPMPNYNWMSEQEIADMVAYLESIAPKTVSDKEVFKDACGRCHSMNYDKVSALTTPEQLNAYMGAPAPDLSIMIRAKSYEYLETFINEPQKLLEGTSMPRVGLTEKAQTQVIAYMEKTGDRKKAEREDLGYKLVGFMALFTLLAYLWKVKIWREVE